MEAVAHECEHCGARLLACDFDGSDGDADDFAYAVDHHVSGDCCKVAARVARELAAGTFTLRPRGDQHDVDELGPNLPGLAFATALHAASKLDNVELVDALLAAGADAARTTQDFVPDEGPGDPGGRTALHVAASANAARAADRQRHGLALARERDAALRQLAVVRAELDAAKAQAKRGLFSSEDDPVLPMAAGGSLRIR